MIKKLKEKLRFLRWAYEHRNAADRPFDFIKVREIRPVRHSAAMFLRKDEDNPEARKRVEKELERIIAESIAGSTKTVVSDYGNGQLMFKKWWWFAPDEPEEWEVKRDGRHYESRD